jgi:Sec7-like guanine-nucleotide exchange factor
VSQAYLSTFDFEGYEIDDMMRIVLNSFSLPKETQMVDRVIGDIAKRLVGLYGLNNDTESYQYFYLLLMVQTTNHNPNVRESERLKLDSFLKMCFSMIGRIPDKAEADYSRIL